MNPVKILSFFCLILFFSNCGNAPQIIHVKEYFYDEEGRLTSIREEEMDVDTFWTKDTFMYDSLNRKIAEERTGSQFKSPQKTTYQYDSDGEIVEEKITGGNDPFDKIFQYTYSDKKNKAGGKDRIEEKQYHIKNSTDTTLYSTILCKYGSFGNWTERTTTIHSQPDSVVFENWEHKHNDFKDDASEDIETLYLDGVVEDQQITCNFGDNTNVNVYSFYENGNLVGRGFLVYDHSTGETIEDIRYTKNNGVVFYQFKYDQDHKKTAAYATRAGKVVSTKSFKYNQNGETVEEVTEYIDECRTVKEAFVYDDSNRLVKEVTTRATE